MNQPVRKISDGASLVDAARVLMEKNVGSLVVIDDEVKPIGLITRTDVVEALAGRGEDAVDSSVTSFMSSPLRTVEAVKRVHEAFEMMRSNSIKHLPVAEDGDLVGMVTSTDLINHAQDCCGELMDWRFRAVRGRS